MTWYELLMQLFITVAAVIPLVAVVVKYVKKSASEKNWTNLMKLVFDLCVQAEEEIMSGADKKAWVIDMLTAMADSVGYDLSNTDMVEKVDRLIDDYIASTKLINKPHRDTGLDMSNYDEDYYDPNQLSFMLDEN